jgi:hypothetical protein
MDLFGLGGERETTRLLRLTAPVAEWSVADVSSFAAEQGLKKSYASTFEEQGFNGKALFMLAKLSHGRDTYEKVELSIVVDKLESIGMRVGDALKMVSALEEVLSEEASSGPAASVITAPSMRQAAKQDSDGFREVSVLQSGSTTIRHGLPSTCSLASDTLSMEHSINQTIGIRKKTSHSHQQAVDELAQARDQGAFHTVNPAFAFDGSSATVPGNNTIAHDNSSSGCWWKSNSNKLLALSLMTYAIYYESVMWIAQDPASSSVVRFFSLLPFLIIDPWAKMVIIYLGTKDSPHSMSHESFKKVAWMMVMVNVLVMFFYLSTTPMANPLIHDPSLTIFKTCQVAFFFGVWCVYPYTLLFINHRCFNWSGPPVNSVALGAAASAGYIGYKVRYALEAFPSWGPTDWVLFGKLVIFSI